MTSARIVIVLALAVIGCSKDSSKSEPAKTTPPTAGTRVDIKVTQKGFEPDDVSVPAGKPVTLVFERTTDETCAKEVILQLADGSKIDKQLPLNTPVEIATTFPSGGKVRYACDMDMIKGTITVQ